MYLLIHYHLKLAQSKVFFTVHLLVVYGLTFLALSSMMVCVVRDPGRVTIKETPVSKGDDEGDDGDDMNFTDALMSTEFESFEPGKWCRKCWVSTSGARMLVLLTYRLTSAV
jgi:palmitoyltransferase ZDHHC2/15/20